MAATWTFEHGLIEVLPAPEVGTFEIDLPEVLPREALRVFDIPFTVVYNIEHVASYPITGEETWHFERGLTDVLPLRTSGDFELVAPTSQFILRGALPRIDVPLAIYYNVEASKTQFTGAPGTFEYGLIDLVPRTYGMSEAVLSLAYSIAGVKGATFEVTDSLILRYDLWAYVERALELPYRVEGEELGARSLVLSYALRRFVEKGVQVAYNMVSPFATFTMTRGERGHLWTDTFGSTLDPRWQVVPSGDRIELSPGAGVKLLHGDEPVYLLTPVEGSDWALEARVTYRPTIPRDQGGIVVWGAGEERYGFFIGSVLPDEQVPTYLRVTGRAGLVEAWSSYDGQTWVYHGSQRITGVSKVGFGLLGEAGESLQIHHARLFTGGTVKIYGLYPGMKVVCRTASEEVVSQAVCRHRGQVVHVPVQTKAWVFDGTLTLYDSANRLVAATNLVQIQGGDEWYFFIPIEVRFNGVTLSPGVVTDAGAAGSAHRFELVNKYPGMTPPLRISLRNLDGTPAAAEIASDNAGEPGPDRAKFMDVDPIPPFSYVTFWIINKRPDVILHEEAYQYEIVLEVV